MVLEKSQTMLQALMHLMQSLNNNVPTSLKNLKTKIDNLDVDKLRTFPVDLEKSA